MDEHSCKQCNSDIKQYYFAYWCMFCSDWFYCNNCRIDFHTHKDLVTKSKFHYTISRIPGKT